jgi:hypothetical protein
MGIKPETARKFCLSHTPKALGHRDCTEEKKSLIIYAQVIAHELEVPAVLPQVVRVVVRNVTIAAEHSTLVVTGVGSS